MKCTHVIFRRTTVHAQYVWDTWNTFWMTFLLATVSESSWGALCRILMTECTALLAEPTVLVDLLQNLRQEVPNHWFCDIWHDACVIMWDEAENDTSCGVSGVQWCNSNATQKTLSQFIDLSKPISHYPCSKDNFFKQCYVTILITFAIRLAE
jgi:hypothetical protein